MSIDRIYRLVFEGKIDEMVKEVEKLSGVERIEGELMKAYWLLEFRTSEVDDYIALANKVINEHSDNLRLQIIGRLHNLGGYWWTAEFFKGVTQLEGIEKQFQKLDSLTRENLRFYEIWFYHLKGTFYHATGDYEKGFKEYFSGLALIDSDPVFPYTSFQAGTNLHIGNGYLTLGDYQKATYHYQAAIDYSVDSGNSMSKGMALFNLAIISSFRGDIKKSLDLHEECLSLYQKIKYQRGIAENLNRVGLVYHYLGNHQKSIEYLELALLEAKKTGLIIFIAITLTNLITVYSNLGESVKAKRYLIDLKKLHDHKDDYWLQSSFMQSSYMLSEAFVLKQTGRFKEQVEAQVKLKGIIAELKFPYYHRIQAMLQLTDLLLLELKTFGNEEIFQEVERLINQVFEMAQEQNLLPIEIETSILKAKLSLINGDFTLSDNLLQDALVLAVEKNLTFLQSRINNEQEKLQNELTKWIELIDKNSSLKERIEQSQIETYLKEAIQIQNLHSERVS
ncbi:hypothetical protein CEE45_08515 [Candidatus Heimdallarchaeota archaeon B3_Heim]|nr:MAG: hypothetical protein CEE45_08515 [Candidatus Heimdallarchaeota archaeon B3_Heim]